MDNIMGTIVLVGIFSVLSFSLGELAGDIAGKDEVHKDAIAAGVAHWSINPVTGEKRFEWGRELK